MAANHQLNLRESIQRVARRRQQPRCPRDRKSAAVRKKRKAGNPEVNQPQLNGPFHPLTETVDQTEKVKSMTSKRNYRKEYDSYHARPKQKSVELHVMCTRYYGEKGQGY